MHNLTVLDAFTGRKAVGTLSAVDSSRGWWPIIRESYAGAWQNNDELTVETQLAFYAVYACVSRISGDMGKLRPRLVEKDSHGIWTETASAAFSPVLRKPNRYQNHIQFKAWWAMSKLTRGNTYGLKQRDGRGVVVATYLLDPTRVQPLVAPDGSVFYQLQADNLSGMQEAVTVPASEIIHDRMNCLFHPLVGISPLFACGLAASQGLAIQSTSRRFFGNGARPSGVLTAPGAISETTAERLKNNWEEKFTGANSGRIAVLGDGLKYQPMVMTSTDAQLIEQLKLTGEMVCTAFNMPAFKVGIGAMPTYQNGQTLNTIYYTDCLQEHIESFELCMDEGLGIGEGVKVEGRELGIDLDLDGLLRMDSKTQIDTLTAAVKGSVMTINQALAKLNMPPVPGGETIWMQQQNYSLAALVERDRNDPFKKPEPAPPGDPSPGDEDPEEGGDTAERFASALSAKFAEAIEHA